jgi:hypothetical protein
MRYAERRGRLVAVTVSLMPETAERLNRLAGFLGQSCSSVAERVLCAFVAATRRPVASRRAAVT